MTDTTALFHEAVALHDRGAIAEAAKRYERVLRDDPKHVEALFRLGRAHCQQGQLDAGIRLFQAALQVDPNHARSSNLLGMALSRLGRHAEALPYFDRALAADPNFADASANKADALSACGRHLEAIREMDRALAIDPANVTNWINRGVSLHGAGRTEEALASFDRAIRLAPDRFEAHLNRGKALLSLGRTADALEALGRALDLRPDPAARVLFANCAIEAEAPPLTQAFCNRIIEGLTAPWMRPEDLAVAAVRLLKSDRSLAPVIARVNAAWPERLPAGRLCEPDVLADIFHHPLLRALLKVAPVHDIAIERFLTTVRSIALDIAGKATGADAPGKDEVLHFVCALAEQCFINEYIYQSSPAEEAALQRVRDFLGAALEHNGVVDPLWIAAIAAYAPLASVPDAKSLLARSWPGPLARLLKSQLQEPDEERAIRTSIPDLTPVENPTSLELKDLYEQNPYPRWVNAAPAPPSLEGVLPDATGEDPLRVLDRADRPEILIAGCGTGREPIEWARQFPRARVLAVDLSITSLAYALRMTRELGITNIEYARADVLKLASIDRTFDLISTAGVLHHFEDPFAAAASLLPLLRPEGVFLIGLYSQTVRNLIEPARAFVAERHGTPDNLAAIRQEIMSLPDSNPAKYVSRMRDFYSRSECRYLLFRVPERPVTIPEIAEFVARNGLEFVRFSLGAKVRRRFAERFPGADAQSDLTNWTRYEQDNPDTFADMYNFCVRKR